MDQLEIGMFIAKKRKEKNFTQAHLAEKLGISNKSISKWEQENVCLTMASSSLYVKNWISQYLN